MKNVREWLGEQLAAVEKIKTPAATEANLRAMLSVVCWIVPNERDWHDEEPAVQGFTERGQNAMAVAAQRVRAIEAAHTTVPPPIVLQKLDKSGHIVQLTIGHENRSVEFIVGAGTVSYVRRTELPKAALECAGQTFADCSAIRELFRWVATGHGQWVG